MRKVFYVFLFSGILGSIVFSVNSALAVEILQNPLATDDFQELLGAITDFVIKIGLALAPVMLVVAGFMFVTSGGDPGRVQTAKKLALYTIIGLAIILLASGLITMLKSILGTTS